MLGYEEPGDDEEEKLIKKMLECEKPMTIYIHVGKLGYIKVTAEARIWAYFVCLDL